MDRAPPADGTAFIPFLEGSGFRRSMAKQHKQHVERVVLHRCRARQLQIPALTLRNCIWPNSSCPSPARHCSIAMSPRLRWEKRESSQRHALCNDLKKCLRSHPFWLRVKRPRRRMLAWQVKVPTLTSTDGTRPRSLAGGINVARSAHSHQRSQSSNAGYFQAYADTDQEDCCSRNDKSWAVSCNWKRTSLSPRSRFSISEARERR
jgi:hypothetical protein